MRVCWPQHIREYRAVCIISLFVFVLILFSAHSINANSASRNLAPVGVDAAADWTAVGDCSGQPLYQCVDNEPDNPDTGGYIRSQDDESRVEFEIDEFDTERGATEITVHLYMRNDIDGGVNDLEVDITGPDGTSSTQAIVYDSTNWAWQSVSWSGSFSQNHINNMVMRMEQIEDTNCTLIIFCSNDGVDTIDVATMYVEVDYIPYPDLAQSSYRLYQNADDTIPGSPLGDTNEPTDIPGEGSPFRLRMLANVDTNNFIDDEFDYRLQMGERVSSCSEASYSDVQHNSGAIRFYDNPSVSDGDAVTSFSDDPDTTNAISYQAYAELNPLSGLAGAAIGDDLLWDFALQDVEAEPGQEFCFRLAYDDGSTLSGYDHYPVVTAVSNLVFDIVDQNGESITNPSISMSPTVVLTECQATTGTLGSPEQRLKIANNLVTEGWGVSIAATDGPGALWSAGTPKYDYNDPAGSPAGCAAGSDSDVYAGQMSIDPSTSSITTSDGCSTTGVNAAPAAAFEEGQTDAIDLLNASSASQRFCDFFVEGVSIEQTIPPETPMGNYSIDMTITIVNF